MKNMLEDWYLNELFSPKIRNVWKLTDFYLLKLILNVLEENNIIQLLNSPVSVNEIIKNNKYPKKVYSSIKWLLDRLAMDGYIIKIKNSNENLYRLTDKKIDFDLDKIKNQAYNMAPESLSAFNMLKLITDNYKEYLNGKKNGIEIIFSSENINITNDYYRDNLFYNVHNIAGAKVLNLEIDKRVNPVVLEIGGGFGGGTKQFLIQRINDNSNVSDFSYYFTDIANKMLRDTKKEIIKITSKIDNFNFQKLNFNLDLCEQGYNENSYDIIWGVNSIHVANDLRFTLNEFYKILKPGGTIVICETVRPKGNQMIQQEIILNTIDDYWNVKLDKDIRPRYGFMDWTDWIKAFKVIGFKDIKTIPDMNYLQDKYDNCYVAVIVGTKK